MDQSIKTQDDEKNVNNQDLADMLEIYRNKLLIDLGLTNIGEEEKKQTLEKIGELTDNRLINLIMIYLPEEKVEEFTQLIEKEKFSGEEISDFLYSNIPAFGDKIINELSEIRKELLEKSKARYQRDGIK